MKYIVRVLAILAVASITLAYDGNVSYLPPTQYTNGDPLLEQDLDFYTLYCDGAQFTTIDSIIGTYTALVDLTPLGEGSHSCVLTVTGINGAESGPSQPAVFTVGLRVPSSPSLTIVLL